MIGPVLVPQDKDEATLNVEKRIEYIKQELGRVDKRISTLATEQEKKSSEIYKLQSQFQGLMATKKA
ncbi:Prefoldin subunit 6 [Smittium mucronatum]|uniref:Prefoldin subunit 6 n=1 Tax=Smittium mucronatum TaxID=133383 RepID=A0A1R0GU87_9FUNG|nr:Prefoldin subunit 6 [Smittium mucronatum]